jgi:hypothetical protein
MASSKVSPSVSLESSLAHSSSTVTMSTPTTKKTRKAAKVMFSCFDEPQEVQNVVSEEAVILHLKVNEEAKIDDLVNEKQIIYPFDEIRTFESQPLTLDDNITDANDKIDNTPETPMEDKEAPKVVNILRDFGARSKNNEWPSSTSVCCYWCCHRFDGPPIGLPIKHSPPIFQVMGCFCSLSCASAWNFSSQEAMDEIWERNNLLNLLARTLNIQDSVRPAPNRLMLKMFGGPMEIEAFRSFSDSGKTIIANFPPMQAVTQQVEEVFESDITSDYKYVPLDNERVDRYKEKLRLKRSKPIATSGNTLDATMNLRFLSSANE